MNREMWGIMRYFTGLDMVLEWKRDRGVGGGRGDAV